MRHELTDKFKTINFVKSISYNNLALLLDFAIVRIRGYHTSYINYLKHPLQIQIFLGEIFMKKMGEEN